MDNKSPGYLKQRAISAILVLVLILSPLTTAGCWDKRELEDQAFAQVIGVDHTPRGVLLTVMFAIPRNLAAGGGGGGGGGGGETFQVTSVESPSVFAALNLFNVYLDRRVNLMHAKTLVIGEEEARTGVATSLGAFMRYREVRRTVNIVVSRGRAADLIRSYKTIIEANSAKWFEEMSLLYTFTGLTPKSQYHQFLIAMESHAFNPVAVLAGVKGKDPQTDPDEERRDVLGKSRTEANFLAGDMPREGGQPIEFLGAAVFRGDKMVGDLTGDETRMLLMMRGEFRRAFMAFEDPLAKGKFIPIDIRQGSLPVVKVDLSGEKPRILVKLSLEGDNLGIQSGINYAESNRLRIKLNRHIEETIKERAMETVRRVQQYKSDVFGFGSKAQRYFATWDEWVKYGWADRFPEAVIEVEVAFSIRRVGMQFAQPQPHK